MEFHCSYWLQQAPCILHVCLQRRSVCVLSAAALHLMWLQTASTVGGGRLLGYHCFIIDHCGFICADGFAAAEDLYIRAVQKSWCNSGALQLHSCAVHVTISFVECYAGWGLSGNLLINDSCIYWLCGNDGHKAMNIGILCGQ